MDNNKTHVHTQLQKLSHQLGVKEEEIKFLGNHSTEELEFLNEKLEGAINKVQAEIWEPMAKVSKFLPNFLNAKVSEDVLGPSIAANLTYYIPVKDAVSISSYFSIKFFSDVVEHLVPSRIEEIIANSPMERMKAAFNELMNRKNYFVVGGLVDHTPMNKVVEISKGVSSDSMLLLLSNFVSKKERLSMILESYDDKKMKSILITSVEQNQEAVIADVITYATKSLLERMERVIESIEGEAKSRLNILMKENRKS